MEEEERLYLEEKERKVHRLVRLAKALLAVYGALIAVKKLVERIGKKFEEENQKGGVKRHILFLDGKTVKVEGPVTELELFTGLSGVVVDLTAAQFSKEASLTVYGLMSGISIKLPPMVRVECDSAELFSGYANLVPSYEDETLPVFRLKGMDLLCGREIKLGHKE